MPRRSLLALDVAYALVSDSNGCRAGNASVSRSARPIRVSNRRFRSTGTTCSPFCSTPRGPSRLEMRSGARTRGVGASFSRVNQKAQLGSRDPVVRAKMACGAVLSGNTRRSHRFSACPTQPVLGPAPIDCATATVVDSDQVAARMPPRLKPHVTGVGGAGTRVGAPNWVMPSRFLEVGWQPT